MPDQALAPWSDAGYVRVYTTLSRDHPAVWNDPALLGWYVRLLMRANAAWPGLPDLPRAIPDDALDALERDQVVDRIGDHAYRFHGLDVERNGQRRRGQRGGIVRASSAPRDPAGRFAPGAGEMNGDAGSSLDRSLDDSLDAVAGDTRWTSSEPALHNATKDVGTTPDVVVPTSSSEPSRARPRETERVDCDDYQAHLGDHRWFEGIGWKCLACERVRGAQEPTFSEKVQAQGGDPF